VFQFETLFFLLKEAQFILQNTGLWA